MIHVGVLWRRFISGIRFSVHRARHDRELDEELREYVQMGVDRNVAAGMSPGDALRAARVEFGSLESVKESVRDVGWEALVGSFLQDLRYGVRMLYRHAGFTAVAILALALGIGVNTAVFTAYKAMVARPLDARDPGEMANFALIRPSGTLTFQFSYPDYEAYRDSVRSFSDLIAFGPDRLALSNAGSIVSQRESQADSQIGRLGLLSAGVANAEFASTFVVSENYFKVLGVPALRGRTFDSFSVAELAASPSVLISENYWQKRFGGDPAVLGKTIHLNGAAVTIVGITPHDFIGTGAAIPNFWMPIGLDPLIHAEGHSLGDRENQRWRLFGRLAPGVSLRQAQAEMTSVADHLRALHDPQSLLAKPATAIVWPGSIFPLPLEVYTGLRLAILLIMAAAAMVLVVACANVGGLQLARARSRQSEMQTRLSLGASRGRVIRQLLTESALLGLLAGAVALVVTWAMLRVSVKLAADFLPLDRGTLIFDVTPDLAIFAYVFAISLVAGVLFGLAPAIESSRSALTSATRASTPSAGGRRIQSVLVGAQVALSLVLLIAGSLLIRSAIQSLRTDPGYDSKHIVDLEFQFPEASHYTDARRAAIVSELRRRLLTLPGVTAISSARPPEDSRLQTPAVAIGPDGTPRAQQRIIPYTYVEPNYFEMLRIPLVLGSSFQPQSAAAEHAIVLSESAAKQLWPGENPVGRSVRLGATGERARLDVSDLVADGQAYRIVGVARDRRGVQFDGSDSRYLYLPMPAGRDVSHPLLIRSESDPAEVVRAIDPLIASIDPDLLGTTSTLEQQLQKSPALVVSSLSAGVATTIGLFGLLLALMGIHGTVSYIVVLRTREVGIRMAIGAQKRDILGLILRESTRPVIAGLLAGMLLAVGASYALRRLLFGLKTVDGISFAGVSLLFLAVALAAAYLPSRRALSVDPMVALRYE
jgi:putative ABC transport system permease protein